MVEGTLLAKTPAGNAAHLEEPGMTTSLTTRVIAATRARGHEAEVVILSALAVGLWVLRARWHGGFATAYLLWNLFLAWIPWLLGNVVVRVRPRWAAWAVLPAWLAFFPNAPYLVTDILHLHPMPRVPIWYDALLYGAFAVAGCALGWTSLAMVRERAARELGPVRAELALLAVAFLAGFGVYLGRFERWSSFDVWQHPAALLAGVVDALCPRAALFTAVFGLFVWAGYLMVARGREPVAW
jgi:uncharacterized membrane protein